MKLQKFAAACAAVGMLATASAASAANVYGNIVTATFQQYGFGVNAGESLVTGFEGGPSLGAIAWTTSGFSMTGTGELYNAWDGGGARPATSATTHDETQYLSVKGGQSVTLFTPNIRQISFYIGSFDDYNHLTISYLTGGPDSVSGQWVADNTISDIGGNQYVGVNNGRLTLTFDASVTQIQLSSDTNSFEISNIGAVVPEPGTWALMIMGFGGAGAMLRRRKAALA